MNSLNENIAKLAPLVARPEWDLFMVYLTNRKVDVLDSLAQCSVDSLKPLQRELAIYSDLLQLRNTVRSILTGGDSKTQYREPSTPTY